MFLISGIIMPIPLWGLSYPSYLGFRPTFRPFTLPFLLRLSCPGSTLIVDVTSCLISATRVSEDKLSIELVMADSSGCRVKRNVPLCSFLGQIFFLHCITLPAENPNRNRTPVSIQVFLQVSLESLVTGVRHAVTKFFRNFNTLNMFSPTWRAPETGDIVLKHA